VWPEIDQGRYSERQVLEAAASLGQGIAWTRPAAYSSSTVGRLLGVQCPGAPTTLRAVRYDCPDEVVEIVRKLRAYRHVHRDGGGPAHRPTQKVPHRLEDERPSLALRLPLGVRHPVNLQLSII
jgi:hypothetical protein